MLQDYSGLKLVVQFDLDAHHDTDSSTSSDASADGIDALSHRLSSLAVTGRTPSKHSPSLTIVHKGSEVPQSSLVKIKTRSVNNAKSFPRVMEYLQLFFGQTPTLYLGIHHDGTLHDIRRYTLESLEPQFDARVKRGLQKLRKILQAIRDLAIERGQEARLSLVCEDGVLKLMERHRSKSLLPDAVLARFTS